MVGVRLHPRRDTAVVLTCNGDGKVVFEQTERDEDGQFSGTQTKTCPTCNGSGQVAKQ